MEIEYRLDGPTDAPVLVLSNSLGTTFTSWQPQMAALTRHFNVLRYNTRGHGNTPLPRSTLTLELLGRDVIDLLDSLGIKQACFCGVSLGGLTGLWLSRFTAHRWRRVVVANTAARIGHSANWLQRVRHIRKKGLAAIAASAPSRWFSEDFIRHSQQQVSEMMVALSQASPEGYAACCEALATADMREEVRRIMLPMLIVAGENDSITPIADSEWLQNHIHGAGLALLPASHLSHVECPQAFSDRICDFLLT